MNAGMQTSTSRAEPEAERARIEAQLGAESAELTNDPDDLAEMRAIREEMDAAGPPE
jgi:hypothetical protein